MPGGIVLFDVLSERGDSQVRHALDVFHARLAKPSLHYVEPRPRGSVTPSVEVAVTVPRLISAIWQVLGCDQDIRTGRGLSV